MTIVKSIHDLCNREIDSLRAANARLERELAEARDITAEAIRVIKMRMPEATPDPYCSECKGSGGELIDYDNHGHPFYGDCRCLRHWLDDICISLQRVTVKRGNPEQGIPF